VFAGFIVYPIGQNCTNSGCKRRKQSRFPLKFDVIFVPDAAQSASIVSSQGDENMKTNRTVVITGAAGGLGVHFVRRFLENDDTVIATDLSAERLQALGNKGRLHKIAADLADEGGISEIVRRIESITGRVDVLINNAGWFPVQPFAEITTQDWQRVLNVNLVAPALLTRAILPLMTGRGWGRLVNIGSGSVYGGVPGQVHYVAAKAGIVGMTRSLAASTATKASQPMSLLPASQ
jgi:NAD(P)-dependent dehydrogenase (short-subunit alcohol dehydrogenase family)